MFLRVFAEPITPPPMSESEDDVRSTPRIRASHAENSAETSPCKSSPFKWLAPVSTRRREKAIEGLLFGCSVADALAQTRDGLSRRVGLKLYGRPPIAYCFQPGVGLPSHRTHSMLLTVQSLLVSRTDKEIFVRQVRSRIAWYQRSFPTRHVAAHISRYLKNRKNRLPDNSMSVGFGDDPLIRAIVLAIGLQGGMNNVPRWLEMCCEVTHADPRVAHAATLVAHAAQIAQMGDDSSQDPSTILRMLCDSTSEPKLLEMLAEIQKHLANRRSVAYVANKFGWRNGIPSNLFAISIMGIYSWLRHPNSYRMSVERAILLGGSCCAVAVVTGSLAGIQMGRSHIPKELTKRLAFYPYDKDWRENLIERVKDWPHGVEDIQNAKGLSLRPIGQLIRNAWKSAFRLIHAAIRFPMRAVAFSLEKPK